MEGTSLLSWIGVGLIAGSGAFLVVARTRGRSGRRAGSDSRPRTDRFAGLRWVPLALLVPLNVVWNERGSLPPIAYPPLSAPILVTGVSARVAGDASTITVEVNVRNTTSVAQQGRVWWQLTTPSGAAGAWDRRIYESAFRSVDLAPGSETRLTWSEQPQVVAAAYGVDAWARVSRGGSSVPSDGLSALPPVQLDPGRLDLLRRGPPRAGVAVAGLNVAGERSLEVRLENRSDKTEQGWLRWTLADPGDRALDDPELGDWWRWAGSEESRFQHFVLGAGDTVVLPLLPAPILGPGDHGVRISLEVEQPTPPDRSLWPDDDVLAIVRIASPPPAQP